MVFPSKRTLKKKKEKRKRRARKKGSLRHASRGYCSLGKRKKEKGCRYKNKRGVMGFVVGSLPYAENVGEEESQEEPHP